MSGLTRVCSVTTSGRALEVNVSKRFARQTRLFSSVQAASTRQSRLEKLREQISEEDANLADFAGIVQNTVAGSTGGLKGKKTLPKPKWLKIKSTDVSYNFVFLYKARLNT